MYAIIDIETTGGQALKSKITEIAIVLHNGSEIVEKYSTLINPEVHIPPFITKLTGINDDMVKDAPKFYEVAKKIIELTDKCVFVAHNVSFDYSFVKESFRNLGYNFNRKTLCTIRLSRKLIPNEPSYSLGKLCHSLGITIKDRHRAMGDAEATAILFTKLIALDDNINDDFILQEVKQKTLPTKISQKQMDALPEAVGVYYFYEENDKAIYIGKSKNIKKRVEIHFNVFNKERKSAEMKKAITHIDYVHTGSELVALLLESAEIKRLKPRFNKRQRRSIFSDGIFYFYNENGYIEFYAAKIKGEKPPIFFAESIYTAKKILEFYLVKHKLCIKLCDMYPHSGACFDYHIKNCNGACIQQEMPQEYNQRAMQVISGLTSFVKPNFMIIGIGRDRQEKSIIWVENGKYKGFGFATIKQINRENPENMQKYIEIYQDNKDTQSIIREYLKDTNDEVLYY